MDFGMKASPTATTNTTSAAPAVACSLASAFDQQEFVNKVFAGRAFKRHLKLCCVTGKKLVTEVFPGRCSSVLLKPESLCNQTGLLQINWTAFSNAERTAMPSG